MAKFLKEKTILIAIIALFVIFNAIFWAVVGPNLDSRLVGTWVGFALLCLGFIIAGAITFVPLRHQNNTVMLIPMYGATMVYLLVNFLTNLIVIFVNAKACTWTIVINIIFLMLYIVALAIAYRAFSRVADNTEQREQRMFDWRMVGIKVSSIEGLAEDPEVKAAIKALKDDVNNSSTASNPACKEAEEDLNSGLDYLKNLIINGAGNEEVLKAVNRCGLLLKTRNQMLAAARR